MGFIPYKYIDRYRYHVSSLSTYYISGMLILMEMNNSIDSS